ncbi:uncharacterized protein PFL1_02555 [Pseudozyma flocculosa PF-1]|uniref:Uncharacterized protein n=1 Tax=Pseudozyma flocculosa PF-1 TaxID=1277687 RepID=A0A061HAD8_9BASI|nr:uncharacterized protein PFL1_02555 [Pseudozyma flocculosa PF-1]EPQ29882.1 hypothetical protein PFL1_02555 [Pseudozyma flocculosa PF-1]
MPSSDQRLDHRPVALHYTVQPVGRTIVPAGPGVSSQWSAPGDAGIIAAGPANEAQNSTRLESAGRVASYSQLLATQLDQQTLPWTWPSALGVVGKWSTGVDGQGLSDRVHQGCHRVHQAWKQVSPFRGSARPLLTSLGQSLPRPGLKASALAHKVHDADVKKALGRPVAAASGLTAALFHGLARQWREADGPKQTFMAVFAVLQVVWLACTVKGWLDRLFGRKAEYRNRRTKTLARKAALAAAGGRGAASKPQPRTWSSGKPRLPPRPTAGHPLMPLGPQRGTSGDNRMQQQGARTLSTTNELETTPSGDIILPSWTENGPSSLMVIVEEPELEQKEAEEAERRIYTHSKKRSDYDRMAGEWDDDNSEGDDSTGCLEQGWSSSNLGGGPASSRLSFQSDSGSLRYRERSVAASLPFYDDVVSTSSASTSSSPPMPRADDAIVTELESAWCRADRAELERGWRDSCMEEGAL